MINWIVECVGVSIGMFYQYFDNKEVILIEMMCFGKRKYQLEIVDIGKFVKDLFVLIWGYVWVMIKGFDGCFVI